jgi:hypothetical protein
VSNVARNLTNYFAALAVLLGCALLYQTAMDYLLRVPDVPVVTPRPPTAKVSFRNSVSDLFSDDAWQLGDCKRLLTENAALLFRDWHQTSEGHWKLEPITIIVGRGLSDTGSEAPIVLTAPEGAEVQFAESLDVMGGSAPPLRLGRMIGDVTIKRMGKAAADQAMSVQTRNVRIDNQKVWTTEQIDMRIGAARLLGRDLTIHLAAAAATAAASDAPSSIVDRLELVYLEELSIDLDAQAQASRTPVRVAPRRIGTKSLREQRGQVSIRCRNGLIYDFALDRLSLREAIEMRREVSGEVVDQFDCDTLDLSLRSPADRSIARTGPLDWIDRINATGRPASFQINSQDVELVADEIDFDALEGSLYASGETGVRFRRGGLEGKVAQLEYQYNAKTPEVLGALKVVGAGMVLIGDAEIPVRRVQWREGFSFQPIDQATLKSVKANDSKHEFGLRVDGAVELKLADGGTFTAGAVESLLRTVPQSSAAATTNKPAIMPKVVDASQGVTVVSNTVDVQTDRLVLYFEHAPDSGDASIGKRDDGKVDAGVGSQPGVRRLPSPENVVQQPAANQPVREADTSVAANRTPLQDSPLLIQPSVHRSTRQPVARSKPRVFGDLIRAQLLVTAAGTQANDVSIFGQVRVEAQLPDEQNALPLELTGDTMRYQQSGVSVGSGRDHLQLKGTPEQPARLTVGEGYFTGPSIKVWPTENQLQVAGAGELKVPREIIRDAMASRSASAPTNRQDSAPTNAQQSAAEQVAAIEWLATPRCRWNGEMKFNGTVAEFDGGVQIDAALANAGEPWRTTMTGDKMEILLSQPIEFKNKVSQTQTTIAGIGLLQRGSKAVEILAEQRDADQQLSGRHLVQARKLIFEPVGGGQIYGEGPGWYRGWMMTHDSESMLSVPSRKNDHLAGEFLQGVHLTFRDSLQADLKNETLTFSGGVRTGMKKLSGWDQQVDVDQMQRLEQGELTMNCQTLRFGITPGIPADVRNLPGMPLPWEMNADGGIVFRSSTEQGLIEGTAARASYESKKSWLTVEGAPNQNAYLRTKSPAGQPGIEMRYPRMALNLKTYAFEMLMQDATVDQVPLPQQRK